MKIKKIKIVSMILCCVIMCMCFSGCGAKSGSSKKIKVNVIQSEIELINVSYYDFYNCEFVPNYSGECTVISNSLNSTEVWFEDEEGILRVACFDKTLSGKPKTVRIYKNYGKTSYDTYNCSY